MCKHIYLMCATFCACRGKNALCHLTLLPKTTRTPSEWFPPVLLSDLLTFSLVLSHVVVFWTDSLSVGGPKQLFNWSTCCPSGQRSLQLLKLLCIVSLNWFFSTGIQLGASSLASAERAGDNLPLTSTTFAHSKCCAGPGPQL